MKTADEYIAPIMPIILDGNFSRVEKFQSIRDAMESYAKEHALNFLKYIDEYYGEYGHEEENIKIYTDFMD